MTTDETLGIPAVVFRGGYLNGEIYQEGARYVHVRTLVGSTNQTIRSEYGGVLKQIVNALLKLNRASTGQTYTETLPNYYELVELSTPISRR